MSIRILVVDDEDTVRSVICQVLEADGHEVTAAASAEEALEAFGEQSYPLVFTDIYMPKMNGMQLLERIKNLEPDSLVIVMTSAASLETATAAVRTGAYDYLTKPFDDIDNISSLVHRAEQQIRLLEDNQNLIVELRSNADKLAAVNRQLRSMADRDGLTGLFNHRCFRSTLENELAHAKRHETQFSIVFLDIDHFKHYNDTHGHLAGDALLRELGKVLSECSRGTTQVARYGGEEFVMLLRDTDLEGAVICGENLRSRIENHPFVGREAQPLGRITVSVGVSSYPNDGQDSTSLIDVADKALYEAKGGGRNRVCLPAS